MAVGIAHPVGWRPKMKGRPPRIALRRLRGFIDAAMARAMLRRANAMH